MDKKMHIRYMLELPYDLNIIESAPAEASLPIMNRQTFRLVLLCSLLLLVQPDSSHAADSLNPEIKDIIVTTSETDLLLFATVKNAFTSAMFGDLRNGIPVVFTFKMELVRTNKRWLDNSLVQQDVIHTLTYDKERGMYNVAFSEQDDKVTSTDSLDQAKKLMAELNGVKVIALSQLIPDAPYAIHFKVTLKKGALPLGISDLVPFSTLGNFETDSRTIEFRY